MTKKPRKGSPLKLKAADYKYLLEMIERDRRARGRAQKIQGSATPTVRRGFNRTGDDLDLGAVVGLEAVASKGAPAMTDSHKVEQVFNLRKPTADDVLRNNLGILLRPAIDDADTVVAIGGTVFASIKAPFNSMSKHYFAAAVVDSTQLELASSGPFKLIENDAIGTAGTSFNAVVAFEAMDLSPGRPSGLAAGDWSEFNSISFNPGGTWQETRLSDNMTGNSGALTETQLINIELGGWGVLQAPAVSGSHSTAVPLVLNGISAAQIYITDQDHKYAYPSPSDPFFVSCTNGPLRIIRKADYVSTDEEIRCLVEVQKRRRTVGFYHWATALGASGIGGEGRAWGGVGADSSDRTDYAPLDFDEIAIALDATDSNYPTGDPVTATIQRNYHHTEFVLPYLIEIDCFVIAEIQASTTATVDFDLIARPQDSGVGTSTLSRWRRVVEDGEIIRIPLVGSDAWRSGEYYYPGIEAKISGVGADLSWSVEGGIRVTPLHFAGSDDENTGQWGTITPPPPPP